MKNFLDELILHTSSNLKVQILFVIFTNWKYENNKWIKNNKSFSSLEDAVRFQNTEDNFSKRWNSDYVDIKLREHYSKLVSKFKAKHLEEYAAWKEEAKRKLEEKE